MKKTLISHLPNLLIHKHLLVFITSALIFSSAFSQGSKSQELDGVKEIVVDFEKPDKEFNPGEEVRIGVTAIFQNGKQEKTKGWLGGKLKWSSFIVDVQGGSFNSHSGKITLSSLHQDFNDFKAVIKITPSANSSLSKSIDIPIAFTGEYTAFYNGNQKGHAHHSKGQNGDNLEIAIKAVENKERKESFLLVYITCKESSDKNKFFIINTKNGHLKIDARGGDGGKGSPGAWGGSGFGNGGPGGNGFDGGDGGNIQLYIDPSAEQFYKKLISIENFGGTAGAAGNGGNPGAKGGEKGKNGAPGKAGNPGKISEFVQPVEVNPSMDKK